jgi:hypothetical protein
MWCLVVSRTEVGWWLSASGLEIQVHMLKASHSQHLPREDAQMIG